jgi:probable F420-dependent oxidoreductase
MKPYRFGLMTWNIHDKDWVNKIQRLEKIGFSSILITDHPNTQWCPTATQAAIASVTETIKIGSIVYNNDFHHPAMLAKSSATIQNISKGRHEFGIGAGWDKSEYHKVGTRFDKPGTRITRLIEAIQIIQSMWVNESTSFDGKHYKIAGVSQAASHSEYGPPKTMIGGGGKRMMRLAGKYADIVNLVSSNPSAKRSNDFIAAAVMDPLTNARLMDKMTLVHESAEKAGRDVEDIEFSFLYLPTTDFTEDVESAIARRAKRFHVSADEIRSLPNLFVGSFDDFREEVEARHDETGIGYTIIPGSLSNLSRLEEYAEKVIKPLTD